MNFFQAHQPQGGQFHQQAIPFHFNPTSSKVTRMTFGDIEITKNAINAYVENNNNNVVSIRDLTSLVEVSLLGSIDAPVLCNAIKINNTVMHSVFIIIDNPVIFDLHTHEEMNFVRNNFKCGLRLSPEHRLFKELFATLITVCDPQAMIKEYKNINIARILTNQATETLKAAYTIEESPDSYSGNKLYDIEKLMLPLWQILRSNMPNPITRPGFQLSNTYSEVSSQSRWFAVDVESLQDPTRVGIVDNKLKGTYDRLIHNPLRESEEFNFRRRFKKDFTAKMFAEKVTIPVARSDMRTFIQSNSVIIGHNVVGDLSCLNIMHPFIVDSQYLYNFNGRRECHGLENIAGAALWFDRPTHYPTDDSRVTMEIVQKKLRWGICYRNKFIAERSQDIVSQGEASIHGNAEIGNIYHDCESFFLKNPTDNITYYTRSNNNTVIESATSHMDDTINVIHLSEPLQLSILDQYVSELWGAALGASVFFIILPTQFLDKGRVYIAYKAPTENEVVGIEERQKKLKALREAMESRSTLQRCKEKCDEACNVM